MPRLPPRAPLGFTLIEVVIVTVLVALLLAIAAPDYSNYLRKGRRAAGTSCLIDARDRMERYFQSRNHYPPLASLYQGNTTPQCPESSYQLALAAPSAECPLPHCYLLTATPDAQGPQAQDGVLQLRVRSALDPHRRLTKTRIVAGVSKTWDEP
jgi:type IV pilus assembly protein PilE